MQQGIGDAITSLLITPHALGRIWFASGSASAPELALQVPFPRLEIVLEGSVTDSLGEQRQTQIGERDVIFIPSNSWNDPACQTSATTLSILFGKQQLGFSLLRWEAQTLFNLSQQHVPRRGPRVGSFLLQALNEMIMQPQEQQTARHIVYSLLSHCKDLLSSQIMTASRSQALFEAVRDYIDSRFTTPLTRESVAQAFYISPNYLSHLFQKNGALGFNEYLNHVRLEHARMLLKHYDLKIKEVAYACGYPDSNYFCRVFRKSTDRSPSEYRRQYHSQLTHHD